MGEYVYSTDPTDMPAIPIEPPIPVTPGPHQPGRFTSAWSLTRTTPSGLTALGGTGLPRDSATLAAAAIAGVPPLHGNSGPPQPRLTLTSPGSGTFSPPPVSAAGLARLSGLASPAGAMSSVSQEELRLQLYQVVAPSLVGRVKVFGNQLALKEEWKCVDVPYFSAPGTNEAPVGAHGYNLDLPPVTMVFSIVDAGKAMGRRDVRASHRVILATIRNTLRTVEGGYCCRAQASELKYMTVFADAQNSSPSLLNPQAALNWCLVMQEALMFADWPESVLRYERCREEVDQERNLLFRGPRLKMGVCEGRPKSIVPDHMGRADYHGASINQAARYMDAAAHGGQVVCEDVLAMNYLQAMRISRHNQRSLSSSTSGSGRGAGGEEVPEAPRFQHPAQHPAVAAAILSNALATGRALLPSPGMSGHSGPQLEVAASGGSKVLAAVAENDGEEAEGSIFGDALISDGDLNAIADARGIDTSLTSETSATALSPQHCSGPLDKHTRNVTKRDTVTTDKEQQRSGHGGPVAAAQEAGGSGLTLANSSCMSSVPGHGGRSGGDAQGGDGPPPLSCFVSESGGSPTHAMMASGGSIAPDSPCFSEPSPRGMRKMKLSISVAGVAAAMEEPPIRTRSYSGPSPEKSAATPRPKRRPVLELKPLRLVQAPSSASVSGQSADGQAANPGTAASSSRQAYAGDASGAARTVGLHTHYTYHTHVRAVRIGIFRFKGSPDDVSMVQLVTTALVGRRYPVEPPKGKGGRVTDVAGTLMRGDLVLPNIVQQYKDRYLAICAAMQTTRRGSHLVLSSPIEPARPSPTGGIFGFEGLKRMLSSHVELTPPLSAASAPSPQQLLPLPTTPVAASGAEHLTPSEQPLSRFVPHGATMPQPSAARTCGITQGEAMDVERGESDRIEVASSEDRGVWEQDSGVGQRRLGSEETNGMGPGGKPEAYGGAAENRLVAGVAAAKVSALQVASAPITGNNKRVAVNRV